MCSSIERTLQQVESKSQEQMCFPTLHPIFLHCWTTNCGYRSRRAGAWQRCDVVVSWRVTGSRYTTASSSPVDTAGRCSSYDKDGSPPCRTSRTNFGTNCTKHLRPIYLETQWNGDGKTETRNLRAKTQFAKSFLPKSVNVIWNQAASVPHK